MITKTLLILANSIKNHERCIAGREVIRNERGYALGPWIRPVSDYGEGELRPSETVRSDGSRLTVMEFADVRLLRHIGDPCHPEDWLIDRAPAWDPSRRAYKPPPLAVLAETPDQLWMQRGVRPDSISHKTLTSRPPASSICVIRPEHLELVSWTQYNRFEDRDQRKFRARFAYNGVKYDLSLTDPAATDRFCAPVPAVNKGPKAVSLQAENGPLVCVSLTPEFKKTGYHYKVVATILGV